MADDYYDVRLELHRARPVSLTCRFAGGISALAGRQCVMLEPVGPHPEGSQETTVGDGALPR